MLSVTQVNYTDQMIDDRTTQKQIARDQEWQDLADRISVYCETWENRFLYYYDGSLSRKDYLQNAIKEKMNVIRNELSLQTYQAKSSCQTRAAVAKLEKETIEKVSRVVSEVLKSDDKYMRDYENRERKLVLCTVLLDPTRFADNTIFLSDRIEREMNYKPPGLIEDFQMVGRCIKKG